MDAYYTIHIKTAAERIRPIVAKGKVNKEDLSGMMALMAETKAILNEATYAGNEEQLDSTLYHKELYFLTLHALI